MTTINNNNPIANDLMSSYFNYIGELRVLYSITVGVLSRYLQLCLGGTLVLIMVTLISILTCI